MKKRLVWLLLPIAVAAAPPVVYNAKTWWAQAKQRVAPLLSMNAGPQTAEPAATPWDGSGTVAVANDAGLPSTNGAIRMADAPSRPGATPTEVDLADVFRFDVTPGWVMQRWPWVSTGLAQLPLQGYRVPLVSGAALDALAGSLTYYFHAQQKVQRITFQGMTGDVNKLLRILISRYGFGRRLTNDPGLFRYEVPQSRGEAASFLNVRLAEPNAPYRRYRLDLAIERPE